MDYNDTNGEPWEWQGMDYCLSKEPSFDIAPSIWNGVTMNQEDLSYMFDEATPVKACGELPHHFPDSDLVIKESTECRLISSQVKRRRTLQFSPQSIDPIYRTEQLSSEYPNSKEMDNSNEDALPETSQWSYGSQDYASATDYEGHDSSSEAWLSECLNDAEMDISPDDNNFDGASDVQIDISEFGNIPPDDEPQIIQECATPTLRKLAPKGRKSYIRTPTKLSSSVAYPFAFIKPCGVHGDVTLKDINQRILTPPPSKSKQNNEDASAELPTSAFSGKPVVGKTKIRTEGGKGSITIMRTKG